MKLRLEPRRGERPATGPSVPHVQLDQPGPPEIHRSLRDWMPAAFPGVRAGASEISDPVKAAEFLAGVAPGTPLPADAEEGWALFLDGSAPPPGVRLMPPSGVREFAHLHPDGSLHLVLSSVDEEELVAKGWGERHPLHGPEIPVVMLYAPRDEEELVVAREVVSAAYRHAVGA